MALYLPAESKAIKSEAEPQQDAAVQRVLGMSYSSIGVAVARALNLPERLLQSMNRVTGSQSHASMTDDEKLGAWPRCRTASPTRWPPPPAPR